jgi:NitT/TauT family transport system ATP-binding protein/nitrate/nitrite transport system substrate-binding protein
MRGVSQPLLIPAGISLGGNTITLTRELARPVRALARDRGLSIVQSLAENLRGRDEALPFGIVHAYSSHNLLLRYWLATAGLEAGREVRLRVVPPARAVEALQSGQIAGDIR